MSGWKTRRLRWSDDGGSPRAGSAFTRFLKAFSTPREFAKTAPSAVPERHGRAQFAEPPIASFSTGRVLGRRRASVAASISRQGPDARVFRSPPTHRAERRGVRRVRGSPSASAFAERFRPLPFPNLPRAAPRPRCFLASLEAVPGFARLESSPCPTK